MSDFARCPCCTLPTLAERGAFELCPVCWWEDDGADDSDALAQARMNYADHFDIYDPGKGIGVVANPSPARKALLAYLKSMRDGEQGYDTRVLHGLLRGLDHG